VPLGAFVDPEQRQALVEIAAAHDRSLSSVIRMALAAHIQRQEIDRTLATVKTNSAHFRPIEGGTA